MKLTRTQIAALEAVKRGEVFLDCKTGNFYGTSKLMVYSRPTPWTAQAARSGGIGATTMTDRLIGKRDIAAMLGTSPGVAASILAGKGIHPIDLGAGRSRGLRWLESAVQQAVRDMYSEAQPKPKPTRRPRPKPVCGLAGMSTDDIYRLTTGQCVQ